MNNVRTVSISEIMNLGALSFGKNSTKESTGLDYKQMKIEAIIRGMPFFDVINSSFFSLSNWLVKNAMKPKNLELLDQFDDYIEKELKERGRYELIHPSLRLGYVKRDDEGEIQIKQPKEKREKKPPREKEANGLFKGTKKAYTYKLQASGKTLEQTIEKVTRKFPDAQEKSIRIWYNKSKKNK